jgi:hypothetical protein
MNLYLVSQDINNDYDTYDAFIAASESEFDASRVSPDDYYIWSDEHNSWMFTYSSSELKPCKNESWVLPSQVKVRLIGTTDLPAGVVLSSFNAG